MSSPVAPQPSPLPRIFVSHSHKDNEFGLRLVADLRSALGGDESAVWYDAAGGLSGGSAWWRRIRTELTERDTFLVILSPDALASPWVNDEIDLAWKQKNATGDGTGGTSGGRGKRIVPVLYRPCRVREDLALLDNTTVSFLPPVSYEAAFAYLLDVLGIDPEAIPVHQPLRAGPTSAGIPPLALSPVLQPASSVARPKQASVSRRAVLIGAVAAGAVAVAGGGVALAARLSGSSTARQTPRTGTSSPAVVSDPRLRWKVSPAPGFSFSGSPLLVGDTIFMATRVGRYPAIQWGIAGYSTSGKQVMKFSTPQTGSVGAILGAGTNTVVFGYVTAYSFAPVGEVVGVRVSDGSITWQDDSAPTFDDLTTTSASDGSVVCANVNWGTNVQEPMWIRIWRVDSGGGRNLSLSVVGNDGLGYGGLAVGGGAVVATTDFAPGTGLIALDADSLRRKWATLLSNSNQAPSTPVPPTIAGDAVYGVTSDGTLYAVSLTSGAIRWRVTPGFSEQRTPIVSGGRVYVADNVGIFAFEAASGEPLWKTKWPLGDSAATSSAGVIVATDVAVYVMGASTGVYALHLTDGSILWTHAGDDNADGGMVAANGTIFLGTTYALHAIKEEV